MSQRDRRSFSFEMKQPVAHDHNVFVAAAGRTFKDLQPSCGYSQDDVPQRTPFHIHLGQIVQGDYICRKPRPTTDQQASAVLRTRPRATRGGILTQPGGRLKRRGKLQKRARTVVRQRHGKAQRALRGRRHAEILHCRNGHYKRNATSKICLGLESRPKRAASRNLRAERGLKPLSVTLANCEELELPDRRV